MMVINRQGCTRIVFLTRRYAFKVPNICNGWQLFLRGLLGNMQERQFGNMSWPEICPVLWSIPGGWLVVMPRAQILTDEEFLSFDAEEFTNKPDYRVPAEAKRNSFGWLDGRIVAIDYGS